MGGGQTRLAFEQERGGRLWPKPSVLRSSKGGWFVLRGGINRGGGGQKCPFVLRSSEGGGCRERGRLSCTCKDVADDKEGVCRVVEELTPSSLKWYLVE